MLNCSEIFRTRLLSILKHVYILWSACWVRMPTDLHTKTISRRCYLCAFRGIKLMACVFLLIVHFFIFSLFEKNGWMTQLEIINVIFVILHCAEWLVLAKYLWLCACCNFWGFQINSNIILRSFLKTKNKLLFCFLDFCAWLYLSFVRSVRFESFCR